MLLPWARHRWRSLPQQGLAWCLARQPRWLRRPQAELRRQLQEGPQWA